MFRHILPLLLAPLAAIPPSVTAVEKGSTFPIGTSFSYQGELRTAGQPAIGLHDFEACLFDAAGPGGDAAIACSIIEDQPLDAAGRFTLELDFGAQYNGSVRFIEMRVRPGASGGAFTPLLPRQAIRPTPEALRAARAPWSGIVGAPAGFSDNVDDVGINSVAAGTGLTTNPAQPGAGTPISSSGTLSVRPGGIDATMIAPGAIGLAQIDASQVQARVNASCAPGDYLTGLGGDGSPSCASLPARFDQVLDQSGDVGSESAIALRIDDRPVLAYYSTSLGNLKLHDCANRACSSGTTRTLDSGGDVGRGPAIRIGADGRPLIAYQDVTNLALKLYVCTNAACSSGTARTLDDVRDATRSLDLIVRADGRPLIAYGDSTDFNARVYDCADADCSSGVSRSVSSSMFNSSDLSLALDPAGLPVIARGGNAGAGAPILLIRCADAGCITSGATSLALEFASNVDLVVRSNDRPLLATNVPGAGVEVLDCTTATCSSRTERPITPSTSDGVEIALDGAAPVLAFRRFVSADETYLRLHRCLSSTCSDGASRTLDGGLEEAVGNGVSIAVRSDGRPVIAHYDTTNDDLLLHICANPDCV
jgi:hypothetical protein